MTSQTPMMKKYLEIKEKHKDAILSFRHSERTLTDDEVNELHQKICQKICLKLILKIR